MLDWFSHVGIHQLGCQPTSGSRQPATLQALNKPWMLCTKHPRQNSLEKKTTPLSPKPLKHRKLSSASPRQPNCALRAPSGCSRGHPKQKGQKLNPETLSSHPSGSPRCSPEPDERRPRHPGQRPPPVPDGLLPCLQVLRRVQGLLSYFMVLT